jgi:2-dehydro-3-deoxygalactonokinase
MQWPDGFIAVDWGTTNRRAYLLGRDGCTAEFEDGHGLMSVAAGGFPAAVAEIRARLGDLPMLMAGMVGSNRGWVEAPYVPCPAGADDIAARLIWPEEGRTAIVPGICFDRGNNADVMRGEEVQIVGALAAGLVPPDATICHPGTHNKWVSIEGARITSFRTIMTGELFNLLREHSILAPMLDEPAKADDAFRRGVRAGLAGTGLGAELFAIRARVLLGKADAADAPSYASGLLIGADVRTGLPDGKDAIYVVGRPELTGLYAAALTEAGRNWVEVDGEVAFLAGIGRIAELMQ